MTIIMAIIIKLTIITIMNIIVTTFTMAKIAANSNNNYNS